MKDPCANKVVDLSRPTTSALSREADTQPPAGLAFQRDVVCNWLERAGLLTVETPASVASQR